MEKINELANFLSSKQIEEVSKTKKIYSWIEASDLEKFCEIIGEDFFVEEGYDCNIQYAGSCYLVVNILPILNYLEISLDEFYAKMENN